MTRQWTIAVLSVLLCSACRIGPPYQRPAAPVPLALKEMAGNDEWKMATPSDDLPKGTWWEVFGDPQLNALEALVNIDNQNVKQAEAQFRQARAFVAANRANYYPSIGAAAAIAQSDAGPTRAAAQASTSQTFSLTADATWEPDLWGPGAFVGGERGEQRAGERGRSGEIRLSQQALLAINYFSLAANDMQQAVLHDTIAAYERNLRHHRSVQRRRVVEE